MIKKPNGSSSGGIALAQSFIAGSAFLLLIAAATDASAYNRYKNNSGTGNCSTCHGDFTGSTSPKGTIFPSGDKHEMHRGSSRMGTACNLCHSSGDNRNPYLGSSTGTSSNPGLGCAGCHSGPGLRLHHAAKGVGICGDCHDADPAPDPESTKPPYYGTVDTKANNPCNSVQAANTNENWSIGDFLGLDNDGNGVYDAADAACGSTGYEIKMLFAQREGNDLRITWRTAGGKTNVVEGAGSAAGPFTNVSTPMPISGAGVVTTNYVDVGAATNRVRFYRVRGQP